MNTWKIHAGWAIVMILVSGAWGRWCASRQPSENHVRNFSTPPFVAEIGSAGRPTPASTVGVPPVPPTVAPADERVLPAYTFEILSAEEIRRLMRSDAKPDIARACRAIEKLSDPKLRKELLLELSNCIHDDIRYQALVYLAGFGDRDCILRLQQALTSDRHPWIRRNAATELGKLGGDGTVELLLRNAKDDNLRVRIDVAAALNQLGHPGAVADLIPQLTAGLDDADGSVRVEAAGRLADLNSPLAIPALVRATRDRNGDVRSSAARGLGVVGTSDVVPVLEALLKDPVPDVVEAASEGLESIRQRNAKN